MGWLVKPTERRWFAPGFTEKHPDRAQRLLDMVASAEPEGYAGCCEAIAGADLTPRLGAITPPTRVIVGAQDPVSPPSVGQVLVDGIPDADLVVVEDASHMANVAQPSAFDAAVLEHLAVTSDRRPVLTAARHPLTRPDRPVEHRRPVLTADLC